MFDKFWSKYPRKEAKKNAMVAFAKLNPEQQQKALDVIDVHVATWRRQCRRIEVIPLPATWLNGWRFDDELLEGFDNAGSKGRGAGIIGGFIS